MKILIIGITGNTGKLIAEFYSKRGHDIIGVGRKSKPDYLHNIEYIQGDIQDIKLFNKLPLDIELVINLAGVQPSILTTSENTDLYKTLREYLNVNINGIYNVVEWVSRSKANTYVYATTHRDYEGYWHERRLLKNNEPPSINYKGDHSMYAISKVSGQMFSDYILPLRGIRSFNLRLPMIFLVPESPYYLSNGKNKIMPFLQLIKNAIKGDDLEVWGDPGLPRDYVYIDNLIELINGSYESNKSSGTYSVGTGECVTTENFVRSIAEKFNTNKKSTILYKPEISTYKSATYDISEQVTELNYKPIYLDEMLNRIKRKLYEESYLKRWGWIE